jgi:hypothetical protein
LNQLLPVNPTPFSRLAATLAAGNKTNRDVTGAGEKKTKGRKMFFLIRAAFWLCVVLALLPTFAGKDTSSQQNVAQSNIGAGEAVIAASATVSDLTGFCSRQPEACSVGSQAAVAFGNKAQAGAKILYEYLNDRAPSNATGSVAATSNTQANRDVVPLPPVRKVAQPVHDKSRAASSRDTLTPTDLGPAWRAPTARKDAQVKHAG